MSFQTCLHFFLMLNPKEDVLKNVEEPNSCLSQLTSIVGKSILCQWGPSSLWLTAFFKVSSFILNINNYTGLEQCVGWVNYEKKIIFSWTVLFMVNGKQTQIRGSAQDLSSTPPPSSPIKITLKCAQESISGAGMGVSYQIYDFWHFKKNGTSSYYPTLVMASHLSWANLTFLGPHEPAQFSFVDWSKNVQTQLLLQM